MIMLFIDQNMYVWSINNVCDQKCICWFFLIKLAFMHGMEHIQFLQRVAEDWYVTSCRLVDSYTHF